MLRVRIENRGLLQRLEGLAIRAREIPQSVFDSIGDILIASQTRSFLEGGRPEKWKPNLEGTTPLVKSGTLMRSGQVSSVGADFVEVSWGGILPYRFIHQFGGTIRAKNKPYLVFKVNGRWVKKKEVTIPRRRYLRIRDEDVGAIADLLRGYVLEGTENYAMQEM